MIKRADCIALYEVSCEIHEGQLSTHVVCSRSDNPASGMVAQIEFRYVRPILITALPAVEIHTWKLSESPELSRVQEECRRLQKEVLELRRDLENFKAQADESTERVKTISLQNQLLLDMVRNAGHSLAHDYRKDKLP